MKSVAIIGNGPPNLIPDLSAYQTHVDSWIGADKGAVRVIEQQLELSYAVGDFDSVSKSELLRIKESAKNFQQHNVEKDETDLELALKIAFSLNPTTIYFFGVTGGRLDHTLINIQLLTQVINKQTRGIIIDTTNQIELTYPGTYQVTQDDKYPTISFIPVTEEVRDLTLTGFYYPLTNATITMGSTLSISNKLISKKGTFSYNTGIVLVVRSRG